MKAILYAILALSLIIKMPTTNAENSTISYTVEQLTDIWVVVPLLIGALVAGTVGFSVNIIYGKYKDSNNTKKLKHVLSQEFGIAYRALEFISDTQKVMRKNAESEQEAIESRFIDQRDVLTNFQLMRINSPLWNAVMSSDILFKLNRKDITIIHHAIYSIQVFDINVTHLIEQTKKRGNPPPLELDIQRSIISDYLYESINNCERTMNSIKELDELDWFDSTKLPEYREELLRYTNIVI